MKLFIALLLLGLRVIIVSGQSYSNGDSVYVISESGLNLRSDKNISSKVVKVIPSGQKLRVLESDSITKLPSINNIMGAWVQVVDSTDLTRGFVFDYYLSKYPPFKFVKNDNSECWVNDLLFDIKNEIGKLDSFEYSNFRDGEGWYTMKYYILNNEAKYIEHGYWEQWENELQLSNLNTYKIAQYVNSILMHCKDNSAKFEPTYFETNKTFSYNNYESCCGQNIRIYSEGNNLIIRIQSESGP